MKRIYAISMISGSIALFAAFGAPASAAAAVALDVSSSKTLSGTAGDFVSVNGTIANTGPTALSNVTAYLSLVDTAAHMPVDLEDWSVEKGLYIGTIDAGAVLPLDWKIHFVKSGDYALSILAIVKGQDKPIGSALTYFHVAQKKNLNPGAVLPVALGEPILIVMFFLLLKYRRDKKSA